MKNSVSTYTDRLRRSRRKKAKLAAGLAVLAAAVAGVVFWQLHATGVAMTNEVFCGMEEHVHGEDCFEEEMPVCGIPEHTHTAACLTDETADTETAADWEAALPELTGSWAEDVAAVAESQVGYAESERNFRLAEDGETRMGYTRYGAWYGNAYGDWDAMFVSFCLYQAGVPKTVLEGNSGAYAMAVSAEASGLYAQKDGTAPGRGDLVFFDDDLDGAADRAGIITAAGKTGLKVVEGNFEDAVAENTYDPDDENILAFAALPEQGSTPGTENAAGGIVYAAEDGGISVTVTAPAGALPEGAELSAALLDEDSSDFAEAADAAGLNAGTQTAGGETAGMAVLDICFLLDGQETEPSLPVTVRLDAGAVVPEDAVCVTVRHLEETEDGIVPVVVAETSESVAEFQVSGFSKFEIDWNDGTGTSITVHVYNMNGTGIEEVLDTSYTHAGGDILISDIVEHLHQNNEYVAAYTFRYATVYYETASGMGAGLTATTLGSEANSVTEIGKSGTTYTVRLTDGTRTTVSAPDTIDIHLYYSLPSVTISASAGEHTDTVELVTAAEYFQGLDVPGSSTAYTWALSDDYLAVLTDRGDGTATFTWNTDNAAAGDTVDVIVTMTNTYTDGDGNTVTEQASDTYSLTYGETAVTISVSNIPTYSGNYGVACVALVDEKGNTVATARINSGGTSGTVTVWVAPGDYTVGVTGICGSTSGPTTTVRSSGEASLHVTDSGGSASVALSNTVTSGSASGGVLGSNQETGSWGDSVYYYEHIDVKIAVAEQEGMDENFSDLDSVYVFDKYGSLIFSSNDLIYNADTDDYNCLFDVGNASDIHSLAVSSEDTVVITYEVTDNATGETKSYTAVIGADSRYPEGEYYQYGDINAYQLYNCIHGTSYTETQFLTMVENQTLPDYDPAGISIAGLTYIQAADYLCDTRADEQGQHAGLDFVIDVSALEVTGIDLRVAKNYTGVPDTVEVDQDTVFTFDLIELDSRVLPAGADIWYTTDGTDGTDAWVLDRSEGTTGSWTKTDENVWTSIVSFNRTFEYESESGTNFYYYILRETGYQNAEPAVRYYGIIVNVSFDQALPEISVSYAELIRLDSDENLEGLYGTYRVAEGTFRNLGLTYLRDDAGNIIDSYYALPFVNRYDAGIRIEKRALASSGDEGEILYADFTLTRERVVTDGDTGLSETVYEYYQPADDGEGQWIPYDPDIVATFPAVTLGSLNFGVLDDGLYILTETAAPDGFIPLEERITFTISNGVMTEATYGGSASSELISVSEDELTLTVLNMTGARLPDAGGTGTWIFTVSGLLVAATAAALLIRRRRKAVRG